MHISSIPIFQINWAVLALYFAANALVIFLIMSLAWYLCEKIKNATFIDAIWSASFAFIAGYYTYISVAPLERKFLLLIAILPWSLRLSYYLLRRTLQKYPQEDKRYADFRQAWGKNQHLFMFCMFQFQGFLIALLSLSIVAIATNNEPGIKLLEVIGTIICTVGFFGEAISDWQMEIFTSKEINKGKTCNLGLWNYSRHPNYFFEWIVWIGIFFISTSTQYGIFFIYCPLLMLYLLTQISGVKLSESYSLKSRSNYKTYQQTTSSFIPWFKQKT